MTTADQIRKADASPEQRIGLLLEHLDYDFPKSIVDVGANVTAEVSRPYIEQGWRALLIDPQPLCVTKLASKFENYPLVSIEQCGCSAEHGKMELYIGTDGVGSECSTFSQHNDPWMDQARSKDHITVTVERLSDLLVRHEFREVGILKIDTEGWDFQVILGLDFSRVRPWVIITEEYLWQVDETIAKHTHLENNDYVNLGFVGYNSVWADRKHGALWSLGSMRRWLRRVNRYPTNKMGLPRVAFSGPLDEHIDISDEMKHAGATAVLNFKLQGIDLAVATRIAEAVIRAVHPVSD